MLMNSGIRERLVWGSCAEDRRFATRVRDSGPAEREQFLAPHFSVRNSDFASRILMAFTVSLLSPGTVEAVDMISLQQLPDVFLDAPDVTEFKVGAMISCIRPRWAVDMF